MNQPTVRSDSSGTSPNPARAAISGDATDWGQQFVKHLESEYAGGIVALTKVDSVQAYRRIMMNAVVSVLRDSGATPGELAELLNPIAKAVTPGSNESSWTAAAGERRSALIDKLIQMTISDEEAAELEQLTKLMRVSSETEEMVPLAGARRLHRELLNSPLGRNPT